MKRAFVIEFPDNYGPFWMNEENLMILIDAYCKNNKGQIKAEDITDQVFKTFKIIKVKK